MFAYCNNNPIGNVDTEGHIPSGITNPNSMGRNSGCSLHPLADKDQAKMRSNTNENAVIQAEDYAYYKGVLYVKVPGYSAFSIGMVFFGNKINDANLVRHEYGHTQQLRNLGGMDYINSVVTPSVLFFWATENGMLPRNLYYSWPWEYKANEYSNANASYASWAETASAVYWAVTKMVSVFTPC